MSKFYCPKCKEITYSLRYITNQKWNLVGLQWCLTHKAIPTKECIRGLIELEKIGR